MSILDVAPKAVGQIINFQNFIDQQADRFIVKPGTARGISGFVFNVKDDDRLELRADVTDYVAEDNSYINDHIALKPMTITLRGFIGELVNETEVGLLGVINTVTNKLGIVSEYLPATTLAAQQAAQKALNQVQSFVTQANNVIKKTQNLLETVSVWISGNTKQEQAFSKLMGMFRSRQIVTVETPWGYFDNMAITGVMLEQDGKTNSWSDISVTLKQLQFAVTPEIRLSAVGRTAEALSGMINRGKIRGEAIASAASAPFAKAVNGPQKNALVAALGA